MPHRLQLHEDRFEPGGQLGLDLANRVLYVHGGTIAITDAAGRTEVTADQAWHGPSACLVAAGPEGATVLRYELRGAPAGRQEATGVASRPLLEHPIALRPGEDYLMRCDRVDFAPGGEALPHGHKGGGIRCLIAGQLEVRAGGRPGRIMKPGDAWFEDGVEPVHAMASPTEPTSFIRVSILPRAIRGQSSIVYVNPAHAAIKPRRYRVFVDEPIALTEQG